MVNMPNKGGRNPNDFENFITKLLGKIFLTKKVFFGFDEQKIAIIVTPTLKIAYITSSPSKLLNTFPLDKGDTLIKDIVVDWSEENDFDITFAATTPQLKLKLYQFFGDVLVENQINESEKDKHDELILFLNNSQIPESIKEWAKDNPEKFIKNIEEIKKLLE